MRRAHRRAAALALWVLPALGAALPARAAIPLDPVPYHVTSAQGLVSTGGAWADVDGDGWLDMVVANGNDMARQRVVFYRNQGEGVFPATPTWSAGDVDYHGHLDIGDINGDGRPDLAVAVYLGPEGFSEPGRVKVYLNDGAGAFHDLPDWVSGDAHYCFSVALGDADGDGDLDLACACGDDYFGNYERQRIYFNQGGTLETTPSWVSDEIGCALDVTWGDVDEDGDLDLICCGSSTPMRIYFNREGGIERQAGWQSGDLPQYGNTTALGDRDGDGLLDLAVADNDQLGGAGRFKVYANAQGTLAALPDWQSADGGYGSHVSWVDLDLDGLPELATGRWWGSVRIYANHGGLLDTQPSWESSTLSVIETCFWGDVDNDGLRTDGVSIASGDGQRTLFMIGQAPVRAVDQVRVDGRVLTPGEFTTHLVSGWVSLAAPPPAGAGNVEIRFTYSLDLDLGVTNWDGTIGNYVFRNISTAGTADPVPGRAIFGACPNPVAERTRIRYRGPAAAEAELTIHDAAGRRIRRLAAGPLSGGLQIWEWDRRDDRGLAVPAGVYFASLAAGGELRSVRLIAMR